MLFMRITDLPEYDNHQAILFGADKKTGLKSFIAIHNTNLGPAAGATRYWHYVSETDALRDALRLSRLMSYKAALADVPFGGGKAIIMAEQGVKKNRALLHAYVKKVNMLGGIFYTGEDVGLNKDDVKIMAEASPYVIGKTKVSGNSAHWTALGIIGAMEAALAEVFGSDKIRDRKFAIKGLGKVGLELCGLIYYRGGRVWAADIDTATAKKAQKTFPRITLTKACDIHKQKVDVYSPCALGGEFDKISIKQICAGIICGGANNQLGFLGAGREIQSRGILYVPDYLANAGGLISVVAELNKGGYDRKWVEVKIAGIKTTAQRIIGLSKKNNKPTSEIADSHAESIFRKPGRVHYNSRR